MKFTDLEFRGTRWYLAEEVDKRLESVRLGLPNLSGIDKAIQDTEYVLKCLNLAKNQIEELEKEVN